MKMPRPIRELLDRIAGRPAAEERDARLERIARRVEQTDRQTEQRLRLVEERQDIKRRVPDV